MISKEVSKTEFLSFLLVNPQLRGGGLFIPIGPELWRAFYYDKTPTTKVDKAYVTRDNTGDYRFYLLEEEATT